jgi:hypothetical protein
LGPNTVIFAWLWSVPVTAVVLRYRTLWPAVIAHYISDLVVFW